MSEWKEVKLGDYIDMTNGYAFKSKSFVNRGIPVLKIKNIKTNKIIIEDIDYISADDNNPRYTIIKPNDLIITMTGNRIDGSPETWVGKVALFNLDGKYFLNQRLSIIRVKKDLVNLLFILYSLTTIDAQKYFITHATSSGGQANISPDIVKNFTIKLPSYIIQSEIAGILSSLDAKIETNNKLNEKLEEMAQAIFKSWFVDFEPFKDKPFHETELGMIPEGWEVKRLCDIVDNIGGYSYKGNELKESTTAMCTIKNFERNGGFKIDGYKEIIPSDKLKASQELSLFDVVVAHTDLTQNAEVIGNPAIILSKSNYDRIIFSMDLTKVISKNMNVSKSLLYCILRNKRFKNHALGYVNGTTVLHMSKKAVPDYMLAFPKDSAILTSLSKCFDSIFGRMHEIYEENDRLASLRDTLLPRLMSGELIV